MLIMVAFLLTSNDSLLLAEECQQQSGKVATIESCHKALVQVKCTDSLFSELALSELKPVLDTLITMEGDINTILKQRGFSFARRSWWGLRAYGISRDFDAFWQRLETSPGDPAEHEWLISRMERMLNLIEDIYRACPTCPEDI
ncbi:MAG: hypothetical protein WDZ70_02780 [Candidatus Paceibacterota bacterium]